VGWINLSQDELAGRREHGNEALGSIKGGDCLDQMSDC
jgi:hypothetical protein